MSTNISGNVDVGGLLSHEYLRVKNTNKNKPLKGQKLSALKDAVTLQKKSENGGSDAGAVRLLRRTEEEQQMSKTNMKSAIPIQVKDDEIITKEATREEFYASLKKKDASGNATYKVDGVLFSAEEMTSMREALGDVFTSVKRPGYNLDYSDYAKMGIAENVSRSYAEKNLSEEQSEVVMKAISEHMNDVIKSQAGYLNPYILEERQLNVTQLDVFSRLMMDRIIFLGTQVDDYTANTLQAQLLYLDSVDPGKDISIYINSPGGSVYAGLGIYDTMQFISSDVATICTGMAASMAAVLLVAGAEGKRSALPHSRVMIHQPMGGAQGQASDIEITAREIQKLKKELYTIIADHSHTDFDKVWADSDRDYWMTAQEAKEYGMIDEVLIKK